jgi:hypothetical protein
MTTSKAAFGAAGPWPRVTFALTILLSAFLLFQVQPLVSKAILPWFGGCPAVWTTCMLFFQMLLFGGYLYAHLLQRWLVPRHQVAVHLVLVAVALAVLPIIPGPGDKPVDSSYPTWHILLLLLTTVGLPYFALSATSPLVQAWFGTRCQGQSPYRLYALSNFGSLAALLTYPLFFEPAFDLSRQSTLWSGAFLLYAGLCAVSLACMWQFCDRQWLATESPGSAPGLSASDGGVSAPTWPDRAAWLLLPACASLMLLATTNHVCQDVAVVPMLWVLPLALYLLSFIICFDHARWYVRPVWAGAAVVALLGAAANDLLHSDTPLSLVEELLLYFAMLFFVCMVCHGELVRRKPNPRYLTEFYLMIAAGGAVGGLLVAVVAPLVFSSYLEWPIGLVVSGVLALGLLNPVRLQGRRQLACYLGSVLVVGVALYGLASWRLSLWPFHVDRTIERARNFFGVISVQEYYHDDPARRQYLLMHGRITHGYQFADPVKRKWATSYYGENSAVGKAIRYFQRSGSVRVGAIGLGVGTLASYAQPKDVFRFYEINPEVLRLAHERFHYLGDCRGKWDVVLGDARLSLEGELAQRYQVLVLDAFSGDAIPTHLLTREAFEVYQRHLAENGVIAVHVSNKYLRLVPVVRRLAEDCGLKTTRISAEKDEERLLSSNEWVLVTRNEAFLKAHPPQPAYSAADDQHVRLWTDQYSNLFQILSGGWGGLLR